MSSSFRPMAFLIAVLGMSLLACQDRSPEILAPEEASAANLVATPAAGNPYFTFLEPLADPSSAGEPFDVGVSPVVEVDQDGEVVARFTTEGRGPERVRVEAADEHYVVNWGTAGGVDAGAYRIRVSVGDLLLGFVDVEVSESRRAIPIRFRIEEGALNVVLASVGTAGATVTATDGGATLDIDEGALDSETLLSVEALETVEDPDGRVLPGTAYEFGPDGTQFGEPVVLTLSYDPALLPAGTSERLLRLHTLVGGRWEQVPGSTVDPANGTVTGAITHFSTYALLPERFVQVAAGERHACGLTESGAAWCWGANQLAQLGGAATDTCSPEFGGTMPCSTVAVEVEGGLLFQSIEAGNGHTCAVTTAGEVYCWGWNALGQLGDGTTTDRAAPVKVSSSAAFASVAAEYHATCALTTTGELWCWGRNGDGELGGPTSEICAFSPDRSLPCSTIPVRVDLPAVRQMDVGLVHACAVTTAEDLYCWGWNVFGQLGLGTATNQEPPTQVPGGPYTSVSAGALHSCAINAAGTGFCWGTRDFATGALGTGTNDFSLSPVPLAGGLAWLEIDASPGNYIFAHSCAVTVTNEAYCWGANRDGALGVELAPDTCQLGFGDPYDCGLEPLAVSGGLFFANVSAGRGFTCGFALAGDVYCWGLNDSAQLGDGTTVGTRTPVKVATSSPFPSGEVTSAVRATYRNESGSQTNRVTPISEPRHQ